MKHLPYPCMHLVTFQHAHCCTHDRSLQSEVAALEVAVASAAAVASAGPSRDKGQQQIPGEEGGPATAGTESVGGSSKSRVLELEHQLQEARLALAQAWPQVAAAAERVREMRRSGLAGPGSISGSLELSS
jgi:hypothetical protein